MTVVPDIEPLEHGDPTQVGPYRLSGRLGTGGMGTVYCGSAADGRTVAVKVIRREFARDPEFRARFLREAQAARRVARFCTAEVLDVDTDCPEPYLVTEYIEGPTLSAFVRDHGPLPVPELERLAVAVANALTAIHAARLVHRDLKPGNILLSASGARVIDFGIARALESTTLHTVQGIVGTPAFMAPEQAMGDPLTPAVDVYAWGGIVLFAATGRTPYGEAATPVVLYRVVHSEPDYTGLDPTMLPLVRQAMSKDPARRPTAQQLLLALAAGTHATGVGSTGVGNAGAGSAGAGNMGAGNAGNAGGAGTAVASGDGPADAAHDRSPATQVLAPAPAPAPAANPAPGRRRQVLAVCLSAVLLLAVVFGAGALAGWFNGPDGGEPATGGPGGVPSQPVTGSTGKSAGEGSGEGDEGSGEVAAPPQDWLAFKRFAPSTSINDSPIVVRSPDGSERQLGTGDSPSLSPDGRTVAFATVDGQIVTAPTDGGVPTPATFESGRSAVDPAWSPNGASVAYFVNTGGLYVVSATGSDRRLVADVAGLEPAWSPDGTSIVFRNTDGDQQLQIVTVGDGSVRTLTGSPVPDSIPIEPSWSRDGTTILFGVSNGGIYTISQDGSGLRQVSGPGTWHPSWAPDGDVTFVRDDSTGSFFAASGRVYVMKPDGTDPKPFDDVTSSGPVRWVQIS